MCRLTIATRVVVSSVVLGAAVASAWTNLLVDRNDFWALVDAATISGISWPAAIHNGFYPLLYPAFLRSLVMAGASPLVPATLLSLAAYGLSLVEAGRLSSCIVRPRWQPLVPLAVGTWPLFATYATQPGPEMAATALALSFIRRMVAFPAGLGSIHWKASALAGLVGGAASLLRYHMLVFVSLVLAVVAIDAYIERNRPAARAVGLVALTVVAMISAQAAVNLSAGVGPFETAQAFNVYKLLHGVNWFHTASITPPATVYLAVASEPAVFVSAWWSALSPELGWLVPALLLALVAVDIRTRRMAWILLAISAPYLFVIAAGGSSRGPLPVVPLAVICGIAVMQGLAVRVSPGMRTHAVAALVVTAAAGLADHVRTDWGLVRRRHQMHRTYAALSASLKGEGVSLARQVFATDFSVYFPSLTGQVPRRNGSWLHIGNTPYRRAMPPICVSSIACFLADAGQHGITHVVVTADAQALSPVLEELWRGIDSAQSTRLQLTTTVGGFKVFRLGQVSGDAVGIDSNPLRGISSRAHLSESVARAGGLPQ